DEAEKLHEEKSSERADAPRCKSCRKIGSTPAEGAGESENDSERIVQEADATVSSAEDRGLPSPAANPSRLRSLRADYAAGRRGDRWRSVSSRGNRTTRRGISRCPV